MSVDLDRWRRAQEVRLESLEDTLSDPQALKEVASLRSAFATLTPSVTLLGGWNAGKSTLLNHILQLDGLIPMSKLPETSCLIELSWGETSQPQCFLIDEYQQTHPFTPREMAQATQGRLKSHVRVHIQRPLLRHATFIDTPGANSTYERHQHVLDALLDHTELVLYVIHSERFLQRGDYKLLQRFIEMRGAESVLPIVTHSRRLNAEQQIYFTQELSKLFPNLVFPQWFDLDASEERLEELRDTISKWVITYGSRVMCLAFEERVQRLIDSQTHALRMELSELRLNAELSRLEEFERMLVLREVESKTKDLKFHLEMKLQEAYLKGQHALSSRYRDAIDPLQAELSTLNATDEAVITKLNHDLTSRLYATVEEVQNEMVKWFTDGTQSLNLDDHRIDLNLEAELLTAYLAQITVNIKHFVNVLEKLPLLNISDKIKKIDNLIITRQPYLYILIKIRKEREAQHQIEVNFPNVVDQLIEIAQSELKKWWSEISQRSLKLLNQKIEDAQSNLQIQKLQLGNEINFISKRLIQLSQT